MGEFLHRHNNDNVHSRAVIVGMINLLNSHVYFNNILSDTVSDTVYVPFFYNMGGDERFLQDYFLHWNDCIHPRLADGNYDVIPRGIVTLSSKNIDTGKMTHRFVRGNYVKQVNGQLQTFSAYLNSIPIAMNFEIEIEVDTNLDAFKVEQAIIDVFYKTQVYSVTYKGMRIPCQVGFSEDYGVENTFEFTYQANVRTLLKFSLTVETYFPVLDPTTERSNANRAGTFNTIDLSPEQYVKPRFTINEPKSRETYFSGGMLPLSWTNTGPIMRVNLYYRLAGSSDWRLIAKNLNNTGNYDWVIPYFDINGNILPEDPIRTGVATANGRGAKLRAIADGLGSIEKIIILERGLTYSATDIIETSPYSSTAPFAQPVIQASVVNGEIIDATIVDSGSGFSPSPITEIELKIEDANSEITYRVLDEEVTFTGDINPSLPAPQNAYITNVVPVVTEMLSYVPLLGQTVAGAGIVNGSVIQNVDQINNRIEINNTTTNPVVGGTIVLSTSTGKIYIQ
jgi:hypothetical protein